MKSGNLNFLELSWNLEPVMGPIYLLPLSSNLGTLTSCNSLGHSRPVARLLLHSFLQLSKSCVLNYVDTVNVHNFKCEHGKFWLWEPLISIRKCKNVGVEILGINSTVSGYSVHIGSTEVLKFHILWKQGIS